MGIYANLRKHLTFIGKVTVADLHTTTTVLIVDLILITDKILFNMLQLIYIACIIASVSLIIKRKKLGDFGLPISAFVGLVGGFLSLILIDNILDIVVLILWAVGFPMFLAHSSKAYEFKRIEENESDSTKKFNETYTPNIIEQANYYSTTHRNSKFPLTDEAFTCYASFLTLILKSCKYDKCGIYMKLKLENSFLLYLALGKGNDCVSQDFPLQQFLQQTETFVFSFGLDGIIQKTKMIASEDEIKFCKTHLMNFANICRKEVGSPAPMQQAINICNAID